MREKSVGRAAKCAAEQHDLGAALPPAAGLDVFHAKAAVSIAASIRIRHDVFEHGIGKRPLHGIQATDHLSCSLAL
jgi:hypothetical protein